MWNKIAKNFLKFSLDNHSQSFNNTQTFPSQKEKCFKNFEAQLLSNGILLLTPNQPTKQLAQQQLLILSAGIHGNETAPMELLQGWSRDLFNGNLSINCALLLIIGNPTAAVNSKRFMQQNLNRLFNLSLLSNPENIEQHRALEIIQKLEAILQQYSFSQIVHFDLHTAIRPSKHEKFLALPFVTNENNPQLLQFWSDCGLTAALRSVKPAATFSFFSQNSLNAISATVELGKVNPFGKNDLIGLRGVDQGIRDFISQGYWPKTQHKKMLKLFQVKAELIKTSEHFKLNIGPDFANFTEFKAGYLVAEDDSQNYQFKIEADGDVLVFPNTNLPVGQRAGLVAECIN